MYLTLGQAAKETGKSKSVLFNALKKGRMSASKGDKGEWCIDPAELFRVYPKKNPQTLQSEQNETQENTFKNKLLAQEAFSARS